MAATRRKLDKVHTLPVEWYKNESQTVQLARYNSSGSSHSIRIGTDQETETQQEPLHFAYDANVSASVKSSQSNRHAHLLKFGARGVTCGNPYCTTCRGYFRYAGAQSGSIPGLKAFPFEEKKRLPWWNKALNPHSKLVHRWNQFFAITCLVAVFIDPLFFFLFSVRQGFFCIVFDTNFATTITVLRSLTDFIYFLHMLLQFRLAYVVPESQTIGAGDLVTELKSIAQHYLKGSFLLDSLAVLPLPQIMIWIIVPSITRHQAKANYTKDILRATVLFQYIPRMIRFLPLLFGRSQNGFIFETAWINFTINLLIFVLAGHVVGSCWYLFSFQRVNKCLRDNCFQEAPSCKLQYLDCGNGRGIADINNDHLNWILSSNSSINCLVNPTFAYGIYASGVPVTLERNALDKYVYALFWGLLQISTLGGNLVPDYFVWEVLFAMAIIGLGLLLIALLIGNMQNFLQSLGRRYGDNPL